MIIKKNEQSPKITVSFTNSDVLYTSFGINLGVFFTNILDLQFTGGAAFGDIPNVLKIFSYGTYSIDDNGQQKFICGVGPKVTSELLNTIKAFGPIESEYAILAINILQTIVKKIKKGTAL